jgi:hypothetical protein
LPEERPPKTVKTLSFSFYYPPFRVVGEKEKARRVHKNLSEASSWVISGEAIS